MGERCLRYFASCAIRSVGNEPEHTAREGVTPMNSLFLAVLTVFFAQGMTRREYLPARMVAAAIVASLAVTLVNLWNVW